MPRHFGGIGENGTYLRLTPVNLIPSISMVALGAKHGPRTWSKRPESPVGVVALYQVADALPRHHFPRIHACPPLADGTQQLESHCDTGRSSPAVALSLAHAVAGSSTRMRDLLLLSKIWNEHSDQRTPPELW